MSVYPESGRQQLVLMKQALNDQFSAVAAKVFLEEAEGYHDQMVRGADDLWMDPQDELIDVNMDIRWEEVKGDDKATRLEHRRKQMEKFVDKASKMVKTEEEKKRKAVRCTEEEVEAMQKVDPVRWAIRPEEDFRVSRPLSGETPDYEIATVTSALDSTHGPHAHFTDGEEAVAPRRASKVDQEMARRDKADREKLDQVMAFVDRKLSSMEEGSEVRIHAFLELMQASFDDVDRMAKETIKDLTEKSKKGDLKTIKDLTDKSKKGDLNLTPGQVTQKLVVALKRYKESDRWLHWVNPHGDKKVPSDVPEASRLGGGRGRR
eukprot:gene32360-5051_t